jgi:hypothetical protein
VHERHETRIRLPVLEARLERDDRPEVVDAKLGRGVIGNGGEEQLAGDGRITRRDQGESGEKRGYEHLDRWNEERK